MELPGPLVEASWLVDHLGVSGLVVAEVSWTIDGSGRARFETGHIPGAVFLDVDADLSAPVGDGRGGRHPLPAPEEFAARVAEAGIADDDSVVVYDRIRGSHAARLWWMLEVTGHRVALLDGGMEAWEGALETGPARRESAVFDAKPWPRQLIVGDEEVARAAAGAPDVVLDARAPERYRGEVEPFDVRSGHIPGARSAPWDETNLDPSSGRFLTSGELRSRYEALGVSDARNAIASCGSGITACIDVLGMQLAGLGKASLYVGSWSGWISDPSRPIATGDA